MDSRLLHSRKGLASAVALLVAIGGCGSGGMRPVETEIVPYNTEQQAARDAARNARYKLRVGDELRLSFKYETGLNQTGIMVLPDGYISPEGLGRTVRVAGLTVDELDAELTNAYGRDYRDPDLSVVVMTAATTEVYVLGSVKSPGMYKLAVNGVGVVQAIAAAGGFQPDASKSEVALIRATEQGFMLRKLDLDHLEHMGIQDLDVFDLRPYDVVYVPQSTLGDFKYLTDSIFGSGLNITQFFWDIYAMANIDKVQTIIR